MLVGWALLCQIMHMTCQGYNNIITNTHDARGLCIVIVIISLSRWCIFLDYAATVTKEGTPSALIIIIILHNIPIIQDELKINSCSHYCHCNSGNGSYDRYMQISLSAMIK